MATITMPVPIQVSVVMTIVGSDGPDANPASAFDLEKVIEDKPSILSSIKMKLLRITAEDWQRDGTRGAWASGLLFQGLHKHQRWRDDGDDFSHNSQFPHLKNEGKLDVGWPQSPNTNMVEVSGRQFFSTALEGNTHSSYDIRNERSDSKKNWKHPLTMFALTVSAQTASHLTGSAGIWRTMCCQLFKSRNSNILSFLELNTNTAISSFLLRGKESGLSAGRGGAWVFCSRLLLFTQNSIQLFIPLGHCNPVTEWARTGILGGTFLLLSFSWRPVLPLLSQEHLGLLYAQGKRFSACIP